MAETKADPSSDGAKGGATPVPVAHLERKQSFAGHGLHHAYTQKWGPIIHAVMHFETPVDTDEVRKVLGDKLLYYPRFASKISADGNRWVPVEEVDLNAHVTEHTLPGVDAQTELHEFVSDVLTRDFDPERPLWEVIVCRYEADEDAVRDRVDIVYRISHSIGDGITLATLLIDLCEPLGDSVEVSQRRTKPKKSKAGFYAAALLVLLLVVVVPVLFCVGTGPEHANWFGMSEPLGEAWRVIITIVWIFLVLCAWEPSRIFLIAYNKVSGLPLAPGDTKTLIKGGHAARMAGRMDDERKVFASTAATPIGVNDLKAVARACAGGAAGDELATVNDVLLAVLGGGLRRYLEKRSDPACAGGKDIRVRAITIANMRAMKGLAKSAAKLLEDVKAARWGNDFSYYIIPLPCNSVKAEAGETALTRVTTVSKEMSFIKRSPEAFLIREGNRAIYNTCGVGALMRFNQHNLDKLSMFMSNLAGPQLPLQFAGAKLETIYNCTHPLEFGMGCSFLSYNGSVVLCVAADPKVVVDAQGLCADVMEEWAAFREAAGLPAEAAKAAEAAETKEEAAEVAVDVGAAATEPAAASPDDVAVAGVEAGEAAPETDDV